MDYRGRLELIALDSRGNARVAECLADGKTLARRLAAGLSIADGTAYAFVPPAVPLEDLYDFASGGILPQDPPEQWSPGPFGGWLQEVVSANAMVAEAVAARLLIAGGTFIVQDWYASPRDPWLARNERRPWLLGSEVYFATPQHDATEVSELLSLGNDIWPGLLGVVSRFCPATALGSAEYVLDAAALDEIVAGTHELLVGVYDSESYLLWTRDAGVAEFYRASLAASSLR